MQSGSGTSQLFILHKLHLAVKTWYFKEAIQNMHDKLLIMELDGRLGNQLFIFAVGYALAKHLGAELAFSSLKILPTDLLLPQVIGPLYREASPQELLRVGKYPYKASIWQDLLQRGNLKLVNLIRQFQKRKPAVFSVDHTLAYDYNDDVLKLDLPVYLSGFFQHEQYFSNYSAEISAAVFSHLEQTSQALLMPTSIKHPVVAVSFRRGDYNSMGWALPFSYYERALTYLEKHASIGTLLLFGDDWDFLSLVNEKWSRSYAVFNALSLGSDAISQLSLMSECEHCVVANSSFSWWGAWFGDQRYQNQNRIVISPEDWVNGGIVPINNSDKLIPSRWIKISREEEVSQSTVVSMSRFENVK